MAYHHQPSSLLGLVHKQVYASTLRSKASSSSSSCVSYPTKRAMSTNPPTSTLRRSYLYVPSSNDRMLQKSLTSDSDVVIYDLEDSVPPSADAKHAARKRLGEFLKTDDTRALLKTRTSGRIAVRVNDVTTPFFEQDVNAVLQSSEVGILVLPKVHSAEDLDVVSEVVGKALSSQNATPKRKINLVSSVESAKAMINLGRIAGWRSKDGDRPVLSALLFAAEDYCADTSIIRTPSLRELLYTRSNIVVTAKAFGLEAIDMVCVNYKDEEVLSRECQDGRELGFTGKQAIHPSQVKVIQNTFVPTPKEILRAAKILAQMDRSHASGLGAAGLEGEMIDAPMIKQAESVVRSARLAGLPIPIV